MFLSEYLTQITKTIDEYAKSGMILSSEIESDIRSEKIGLIRGNFLFIGRTKLFFTEYLDLRYRIEKLSYSFHYQDKESRLIFRYDNAVHKPALEFSDHKHVGNKIYPSTVPKLRNVMAEIISGIEL